MKIKLTKTRLVKLIKEAMRDEPAPAPRASSGLDRKGLESPFLKMPTDDREEVKEPKFTEKVSEADRDLEQPWVKNKTWKQRNEPEVLHDDTAEVPQVDLDDMIERGYSDAMAGLMPEDDLRENEAYMQGYGEGAPFQMDY